MKMILIFLLLYVPLSAFSKLDDGKRIRFDEVVCCNGDVHHLMCRPTAYNGVFISPDLGKTWKFMPRIPCKITKLPKGSSERIITVEGRIILLSKDNGSHWEDITPWQISNPEKFAMQLFKGRFKDNFPPNDHWFIMYMISSSILLLMSFSTKRNLSSTDINFFIIGLVIFFLWGTTIQFSYFLISSYLTVYQFIGLIDDMIIYPRPLLFSLLHFIGNQYFAPILALIFFFLNTFFFTNYMTNSSKEIKLKSIILLSALVIMVICVICSLYFGVTWQYVDSLEPTFEIAPIKNDNLSLKK